MSVLKNFTNDYLEKFVYNPEYPADKRKFLMDTFLQMDFLCFGRQLYTNLPTDLYDGYGEYNQLDIMEVNMESANNGKFLYNLTCATFHVCANNCSLSTCDYNNCQHGGKCKVWKSCANTATWVDDPISSYPSNPSCGPGCGGGGSSPNPNNPPKSNPCAERNAFYRVIKNCGGSGTGSGTDLVDDPCEIAKAPIKAANDILKNPDVQSQMDAVLRAKADLPNEWAMAVGFVSNAYIIKGPAEGTSTGSTPPAADLGDRYIADGHSHAKGRGSPSAADLYGIMSLSQISYMNFRQRYVYGMLNGVSEVYALVVTNEALAGDFLTNFPISTNFDSNTNWFKEESKLWEQADKIMTLYKHNNISNTSGENHNKYALALGYILDQHNTGIALAKVDANGNLKKVNVSLKPTTTNGFPDEKIEVAKCP